MVEVSEETGTLYVAFSLDLASYEVAKFCRDLSEQVGNWSPMDSFFIVVGERADDTEKMLHGDRASMYRAFRDCGLLEGGSH